MKRRFDFDRNDMYRAITIAVTVGMLLLVLNFFPGIRTFISKFFNLMTPFIVGFFMALMVRPIEVFLERFFREHAKMSDMLSKVVSVVLSVLLIIVIIVLFFVAVIPQITNSVITIGNSVNTYSREIREWFDKISSFISRDTDNRIIEAVENAVQQFLESLPGQIMTYVDKFIGSVSSFVNSMWQFILGLIISVYFLSGYDKIAGWTKRTIRAFLPEDTANSLIGVIHTSLSIFTKFVAGKSLDSIIIGLICLIGCLILGFEFPYLIAFIIGLTNMIPFFGPIIGAVPSIFILLFNNPWHALWFGIFIIVLQQFDGNFLGPKIIGEQLGLPSIMIIFSVIVGGGLLGVFGMFLGVPFFALIYTLIKDFVHKKELEKKTAQNVS